MQQVRLAARRRAEAGKGAARSLRRAGSMPAVLYGHQQETLSLQIDSHTFERLVISEAIENTLINLDIDGEEETVMVRDMQRDPISREILHTDFLRVSLTEMVTTHVPLVLDGSPLGVREEGGILEFAHRDLGVRCLPTEMPSQIEISVSVFAVGNSIRVSDIQLPDSFEYVSEPTTLVLSIRPPIVRTVEEIEETEETGDEPEVITRRREDEDGE